MKPLRFALFGTGFWSRFQLAAWRELPGVECVALYNRTRHRAERLAADLGITAGAVYDDAEELLAHEAVDFIDIVTDSGTHREFVEMAARQGKAVICQKPMAQNLTDAEAMTAACAAAGVPFYIHENWRWQAPLRELGNFLKTGALGPPFRGRLDFVTSFPVFQNQPFLAQEERFILTDIGSHVLDTARFLFGEASRLFCLARRVNPSIKGEDVATVMMLMDDDVSVVCNLSYASRTEHESFPETFAFIECERGSVELKRGGELRITSASGVSSRVVRSPHYAWADPAYEVVHASIVECHRDLLRGLRGEDTPETSAESNLRTMRLIHAAYESTDSGQTIHFP